MTTGQTLQADEQRTDGGAMLGALRQAVAQRAATEEEWKRDEAIRRSEADLADRLEGEAPLAGVAGALQQLRKVNHVR